MENYDIIINLDGRQLRAAQRLAESQEISLGQLVRDALNSEIERSKKIERAPDRAGERVMAELSRKVAQDLAHALSWADLETRLRRSGIALRIENGRLALYWVSTGAHLSWGSDLGFGLQVLSHRFRAAFPSTPLKLAVKNAAAQSRHR